MQVARQRQPSTRRPAIQLPVKTILNAIQRFPGFVFHHIRLHRHRDGQPRCIEITVQPHPTIPGKCSRCLKPAPGYDRLEQRARLFVPLWGIVTRFLYAARRVHCPEHGVVVEHVRWSEGKRPVTIAMMWFLSRWARRLSWRETARAFGTSWECVYRLVQWFVGRGLAHRVLEGVRLREITSFELDSSRSRKFCCKLSFGYIDKQTSIDKGRFCAFWLAKARFIFNYLTPPATSS